LMRTPSGLAPMMQLDDGKKDARFMPNALRRFRPGIAPAQVVPLAFAIKANQRQPEEEGFDGKQSKPAARDEKRLQTPSDTAPTREPVDTVCVFIPAENRDHSSMQGSGLGCPNLRQDHMSARRRLS
jgi:hypothetical protein